MHGYPVCLWLFEERQDVLVCVLKIHMDIMMKGINRFLLLCSGSSLTILRRCPTENTKYAGIGATIFFTGLMAGLASGFAVYTVFEDYLLAGIFGFLWGLMIFNLDRLIVSGMRKRTGGWQEFRLAIPRIILAVLIAIIIARPLEMRIFQKEINNELLIMKQELRMEQEGAIMERFTKELEETDERIALMKEELAGKSEVRDHLKEEAIREADGTGGTGIRNAGPVYRLKKADADSSEKEFHALSSLYQAQIKGLESRKDSIYAIIGLEKEALGELLYDGLASRLEALGRLTDKSQVMQIADWFIMLLFIAIECSPILVKLMSSGGPYDFRLQEYEHLSDNLRIAAMVRNSSTTREIVSAYSEKEQNWGERELANSLNK